MLWKIWSQTLVPNFEELYQYLPSKTEKNHKKIDKDGRERRKEEIEDRSIMMKPNTEARERESKERR
jgi:hypothetical protein